MAIYQVQKGTITCDKCEKVVGHIRSAKVVMETCILNQDKTRVLCVECYKKENPELITNLN